MLELFENVFGRLAADLYPLPGEQGAGAQNEANIEESVDRVIDQGGEMLGRRDHVGEAGNGDGLATVVELLPLAEESDEEVGPELFVEELGDEVEVGDEGGLEDDGDVAGVEQFDGVGADAASDPLVLHGDVDFEALEVDHDQEHQQRGQQVVDVRQRGTVEGLLDGAQLVGLHQQAVQQTDQRALVLLAALGAHGHRRESLPDDGLAHVDRDEQVDARAQSEPVVHQLVQQNSHVGREHQLHHDQARVAVAQDLELSVHAAPHVGHSFEQGDAQAHQLLKAVVEFLLLLRLLVVLDDFQSAQKLDDHPARHDRGNA